MTSNPLQPLKPTKSSDDSNMGATSGSQSQTSHNPNAKSPQANTGRDEGARSFKSVPEAGASSATRSGGSSEVLRYLDSIEEFVGKARTALSASSRDGSSQSNERQANERQTNEGGPRSSRSEDASQGNDRTRSNPNAL